MLGGSNRIFDYGTTDRKAATRPTALLPLLPASVVPFSGIDRSFIVPRHLWLSLYCGVPLGGLALERRHDSIRHGTRWGPGFERRQDLRFLLRPFLRRRLHRRLGHTVVTDVSSSASSFSHRTEGRSVRYSLPPNETLQLL